MFQVCRPCDTLFLLEGPMRNQLRWGFAIALALSGCGGRGVEGAIERVDSARIAQLIGKQLGPAHP